MPQNLLSMQSFLPCCFLSSFSAANTDVSGAFSPCLGILLSSINLLCVFEQRREVLRSQLSVSSNEKGIKVSFLRVGGCLMGNLLFIVQIIIGIFQGAAEASTMNTRSENDILKEILAIKKKITIPSTELESFLQYLDQTVFKRGLSFCGPPKCTETPQFTRAFGTLSNMQRADYYLCCLKIVQELNRREEVTGELFEKQQFDVSYRLNKSKQWVPTTISVDPANNSLFFNSTSESIKLQNYIIRYSKCKERNAFVLECCIGKNFYETIRISHSNYLVFEDLQTKVKNLVINGLKTRLLNMISICKKTNQLSTKSKLSKKESISVAILSKGRRSLRQLIQQSSTNLNFTLEDYNAISGTLVDEEIVGGMDNFTQYEEINKDIFVHTSKNRVKKVYYLNQNNISKQWLIEQLFKYQNFKIWKSSLFMISLLAQIPSEKSMIFHEINMYKDSTECDYVYLRHYFTRGQVSYFIDKSISTVEYGSHQTSKSRGVIEYCIWRIKKSAPNKLQVIVQCELSHVDCTDIYDVICQQIGELQKIVLCRSSKAKNEIQSSMDFQSNELQAISFDDNKQFTSYEGISQSQNNEVNESAFYSIYSKDNGDNEPDSSSQVDEQVWQFQNRGFTKPVVNKYRYQTSPLQNGNKVFKMFKNGQFFNDSECVVTEQGDLLFVNQQKIKAQSSVLKNVLKKIGTNIFSGKSILNISLPIQIFATDTNLQRLCKATAYAPLFLENKNVAPPLERMKSVIGFSLGNVLLYIDMAKPFNPVIGETFQGFVDGCPLYGEQISHHPPISSVLLKGRGYYVYANLEAKVQFGLNNVSGINEGLYHVAFHDSNPSQNIISFNSPPGQLSGTIYGDRKLALIKKTRFFDEKNQLFCQISWGKSKKSPQTNFNDYMEGAIVRLHEYQMNINKIKTSKQDEILGIISGRWTKKIYFNSEVIFDVNVLQPFQVTEEIKLLQSDGKFRRDRQLVESRKFPEAQAAKEQIEEFQRRDRKLRKQMSKTH